MSSGAFAFTVKDMEPDKEQLLAFGGEIKALGDGMIGGSLVAFTDDTTPDVEAEYFTKNQTDYDHEEGQRMSVYYDHGQDATLGVKKLGKGKAVTGMSDADIWIKHQLDLRDEYEAALYKMAEDGKLGWSSGTAAHLVRKEPQKNGAVLITHWPLGSDASITYRPAAGMVTNQVMTFKSWQRDRNQKALIPEAAKDTATDSATGTDADADNISESKGANRMTELTEDTVAIAAEKAATRAVEAVLAKQAAEVEARTEQEKREDEIAEEAVKAYQEKTEKKATNEPGYAAPNVLKHGDVRQYDNYSAADLATTFEVVGNAKGLTARQINPAMVKALALRMDSDEAKGNGSWGVKANPLIAAGNSMKSFGIKANETDFSTNAGFGDEWIGVAYSGSLWESIRVATFVVNKLNPMEFPAGAESMVIPLESTDPVWYLVAQAGDPTSATAQISNTVPAKALATAQTTMTLAKLGSSTIWTGEMVEEAVLPFANQLRDQIAVSGGEYLESAVVDGDTETGASANINDIAGTPAATDWFLVWNGLRKSPLVTTTANSRDGGALTSGDYLETVKLMGGSGINGLDRSKVSFVIDPSVHYKSLELADVKSRDVFGGATIEGGMLTGLYGYGIDVSGSINKASAVRLSNSAGKVDVDTVGNNTKGVILAARWDQWSFAFRRQMTQEVERIPRADAWEITTLMRAGLIQRDTEASAITYNLTV